MFFFPPINIFLSHLSFAFSVQDTIRQCLDDFDLKGKIFTIDDIRTKITKIGPYQNVFLQECEYMNALLKEIVR